LTKEKNVAITNHENIFFTVYMTQPLICEIHQYNQKYNLDRCENIHALYFRALPLEGIYSLLFNETLPHYISGHCL